MKIVVCVKQVPLASELRFDRERKAVRREGVTLTLNAYDRRSLAEAVRLRGLVGGEVVALAMGPPSARAVLAESLALGCGRAIHVCDPALASSDALVTARVLAAALRPEAPDLVFCGRRSVDGETGIVGPALAELLGYAQVTAATKITPTDDPRRLIVEREADDCIEVLEVPLPAVLTAAERLARAGAAAPGTGTGAEQAIRTVTSADLGLGAGDVGGRGSRTRVKMPWHGGPERRQQMISGKADEATEELADALQRQELLLAGAPRPPGPARLNRVRQRRQAGEVWVVADLLGNQLQRSSLDLLAYTARQAGNHLAALLIGGPRVREHREALTAYGAKRVYIAADECLAEYQLEPYAELCCRLFRQHRPRVVLFSANAMSRDLAPRLAARLELGLVTDCIGARADLRGAVGWRKSILGGSFDIQVKSAGRMHLGTVRSGALPRYAPLADIGEIEYIEVETAALPSSTVRLGRHSEVGSLGRDLEMAHTVVCVGSGLGGPEHLPAVEALARALGGVIGATRKVVDHGWLPVQQQIGLTGKTVAPRLYFGIGISGGFNHTVGIRRSGTIVAINSDPKARIFEQADYGIVGDWREVVPALTRAIRERLPHPPVPSPGAPSPPGLPWGHPHPAAAAAVPLPSGGEGVIEPSPPLGRGTGAKHQGEGVSGQGEGVQ